MLNLAAARVIVPEMLVFFLFLFFLKNEKTSTFNALWHHHSEHHYCQKSMKFVERHH
jgi:hypothetical protein